MEVEDSSDTFVEEANDSAHNISIEEQITEPPAHSLLTLGTDMLQTIFEQAIVNHAATSIAEDRAGVFYKSFKDIITLTKRTSKRLSEHTNNRGFWLGLHQACYMQRDFLGCAFKEVSFKTTYMNHISDLSQGELCANLFDMVIGNTSELKRKRDLAVELSFRNALQLHQHYVPAVFYKVNSQPDTIYVRKAVTADHPSTIQYKRRVRRFDVGHIRDGN
jgi:hypothetical protein